MNLFNNLIVSEKFYSIQGEGYTSGFPAVFLRLGGCNILCKGKGWICDTIEVWKKSKSIEFPDVLSDEEMHALKAGAHLVITGGEPMLHQESIVEYINCIYKEFNFRPFIEIETNGTIEPIKSLLPKVTRWNVSPKLSSAGEKKEKRYKPEILKLFNRWNTTFKFVISSEEDIEEIFEDFGNLDKSRIMFMPAGDTQELLNEKRLMVIEACKKNFVRYTERLHIVAWNKKTGV